MNNKLHLHSSTRNRRFQHPQNFDLTLSNTPDLSVTSLNYSHSTQSPKFINLSLVPEKQLIYPQTTEFLQQDISNHNHNCNRKDCIDRKFQVVKRLNKSAPNSKIVSPRKVDIVLSQNSSILSFKRQPTIHTARKFHQKHFSEKDLLKQFKELEEIRKQLKSRNFLKKRPVNLSVNTVKNTKQTNVIKKDQNPEQSNLYLQVKTRISRRYNIMFRKYAQGIKQQIKEDKQYFKGLCCAHGIYSAKQIKTQKIKKLP